MMFFLFLKLFVWVEIIYLLHKIIKKFKTMNKTELIDAIAQDAGITKIAAKKALESFTNNITKALAAGDRVSLIGFGSFSVSQRSAREGINPQTKKKIQVAAKKVAKFKAGAELATSVNN